MARWISALGAWSKGKRIRERELAELEEMADRRRMMQEQLDLQKAKFESDLSIWASGEEDRSLDTQMKRMAVEDYPIDKELGRRQAEFGMELQQNKLALDERRVNLQERKFSFSKSQANLAASLASEAGLELSTTEASRIFRLYNEIGLGELEPAEAASAIVDLPIKQKEKNLLFMFASNPKLRTPEAPKAEVTEKLMNTIPSLNVVRMSEDVNTLPDMEHNLRTLMANRNQYKEQVERDNLSQAEKTRAENTLKLIEDAIMDQQLEIRRQPGSTQTSTTPTNTIDEATIEFFQNKGVGY